jgi:hypothetical protein
MGLAIVSNICYNNIFNLRKNKMKKIFAILALAATASAFADSGVSFEFERERGTASPNTMTNTVKVAPYVKLDNGVKLDLQFGASRDDGQVSGNNNALENTLEARAQKLFEVYPGLKLGARVGVGQVINGINSAGTTVDFGYYTVEPKAEYMITDRLSALASFRFRNGFSDSDNYLTRTWKAGFGYGLTKHDIVEVKYFQKRGDYDSNGMLVEYSRSF